MAALASACSDATPPLQTAVPGVVFTYPIDRQLDVPLGTRIVVTFSEPVDAAALGSCAGQGPSVTGAFCLVGPTGPISAVAEVTNEGRSVQLAAPDLEPGTTYELHVRSQLDPAAQNLPTTGPLVTFTTRTSRPRAAPPALVAVNGSDPARPEELRPLLETSTLRLVFSEPLDPRTVTFAAGSIELVDAASRTTVPSTVLAKGIHVAIDPIDDLAPDRAYELRLGNRIADLGGQTFAPATITFTPKDIRGTTGPIAQVLRTRQPGDAGPAFSRSGSTPNVIEIDKPLIGRETSALEPSSLAAELGDPKALGGPIAFTIRRGQRLAATGLDVKLGGTIPVGLSTGAIQIELLTDGGGRLYRNRHQAAEQRPETDRAPLYVDLSLDVAVYAVDPMGNAVLTQTVLGVQASGTAVATDGVLAIETIASMELGLLGVTEAPTNFVLELVTDPAAAVTADTTPPLLLATSPAEGSAEHAVDAGIELIFSEPVDLDRLRAGGVRLETAAGGQLPGVIESHGASIVIRPLARLAYSTGYRVVLSDVADVAGNALADTSSIEFATPRLVGTDAPMTVVATHPGVPCTLTGGTAASPGRCAGGGGNDDLYRPFSIAANEAVEVAFSQPPNPATVTRGAACNTGSVRIEELDAAGACVAAVAGTLIPRDRSFAFVPDQPWTEGQRYRLVLVSGGNRDCNAGELCGVSGDAASFDPLNGTEGGDSGGANLTINFVGAAASNTTFMFAEASPYSDINGSGFQESGELARDDNRAALRIVGTSGSVSDASFTTADCLPSTPEVEGCMYLLGAMPVALGEVETGCTLPGGTPAASCVPVTLSPQTMYATSLSMEASVGISIGTETGTSVMRIREPSDGPVRGFIIDDAGTPTMVVALDLYMDAPDMSITLSSHDLHSKPLSLVLRGPVSFLPDGRITISLSNVADVPVSVSIDAPLGIGGSVDMIVPRDEMRLQLSSAPLRGRLR